jgi:uncharacterized membrane protein YbhN (UPF0104 family)
VSDPPYPAGAARPRWRRWLLLGLRLGLVAVVVVGFYYFLRGLRVADLAGALRGAHLAPLAAAAVVSFATLFAKAICWRLMLAPVARVPVLSLFRYTIAAFGASIVMPARGGELLRLWLLKQRDGVPLSVSAGVAVSDKLFDVVAMLTVISPLPFLLSGAPPWVGRGLLLVLALAVVAILVARFLATRGTPGRFLARFATGLTVFRQPRIFLRAWIVLLCSWSCELLAVWLVFRAVGIHQPIAGAMLVLLTINLAVVAPSTPGQVGVLEFGAMIGLEVLGVPRETALAFALLYHGMQVIPLFLVALADVRFVLAARRGARADEEQAAQAPAADAQLTPQAPDGTMP